MAIAMLEQTQGNTHHAQTMSVVNSSGGGVIDGEGRTRYGMDAELALKRMSSFDPAREFAVRVWIEAALGARLNGLRLTDALGSGKELLQLLRVMGIDVPGEEINSLNHTLHHVENRKIFLDKCLRGALLRPEDAFNPHTMSNAALTSTLEALARTCASDARFAHVRDSLPPAVVSTVSGRQRAPAPRGGAAPPPVSVIEQRDDDPVALRNEVARLEAELAFERARANYLEAQLNSDGVPVFFMRIRFCPSWSRTRKRVVAAGLVLTTVLAGSLYVLAFVDPNRMPQFGQRAAALVDSALGSMAAIGSKLGLVGR
jgi:hypothetical protein